MDDDVTGGEGRYCQKLTNLNLALRPGLIVSTDQCLNSGFSPGVVQG